MRRCKVPNRTTVCVGVFSWFSPSACLPFLFVCGPKGGRAANKMRRKQKVFPFFVRRAMGRQSTVLYEVQVSPVTKVFVLLGNITAFVYTSQFSSAACAFHVLRPCERSQTSKNARQWEDFSSPRETSSLLISILCAASDRVCGGAGRTTRRHPDA